MTKTNSMNAPVITQDVASKIVKNMIERGNQRPIMFFGKGGIGKTQAIKEIADELNIGYIDVRLLLYTESDLKGIPYVNKEHTATIFLQNDILPQPDRDGEKGILVFDEITSCPQSVRTAAYQLLNERRLGEYELPEGWSMICLGNGENDGGQFNGMEANFANRCSVYEIVASVPAWKKWAIENGINTLVLGFISWQPHYIHTMKADEEEEIVFASPRSWKAVSDILNVTEFDENDPVLEAEIKANIGNFIGGQFLAFCKFKDSEIDPMNILNGIETKIPKRQEVLFMTMQALIKLMSENIKNHLANGGVIEPNSIDAQIISNCSNGVKWILSLTSLEHRTMGIKDFMSANPELMPIIMINEDFCKACPELNKFAMAHSAVFV